MADDVSIKVIADTSEVKTQLTEVRTEFVSMGTAFESVRTVMVSSTTDIKTSFSELSVAAQAAGEKAKESADKHEGLFSKLKSGVEHVADFAKEAMKSGGEVIELGKKVYEFAKGMGEAGEKTEHTSKALGMTVADTQRLSSVFAQAGGGPDALSKAMTSLNQASVKAVSGNKETADAFKKIGVDLNTARTPAELMDATMKGLASLPGPDRAAAATKIFGDKMEMLGPISSLTKEKLEEFNKQAISSGAVMPGAVTQAAALGEAMNASQNAMTGVNNVLADALAPSLTEIVKSVTSLIVGFTQSYTSGGLVKQLMDTIGATIHVVGVIFEALIDTAVSVWKTLTGGADNSRKAIDAVQFVINALGKVFIILGVIIQSWATIVKGEFDVLTTFIQTFALIVWHALMFDWDKIAGDVQNGANRVADIVKRSAKDVADHVAQGNARLHEVDLKSPRAVASTEETKATKPKKKADGKKAQAGVGRTPARGRGSDSNGNGQTDAPKATGPTPEEKAAAEARARTLEALQEATDTSIAEANRALEGKKTALDQEIKATEEAMKSGELSASQGLATLKVKIEERKQAEIDAAAEVVKARLKLDQEEIEDAAKSWQEHARANKKKFADEQAYLDAVKKVRQEADKAWVDDQKTAYAKARSDAEKFYKQVGDFARSNIEGLIKGTESWSQLFSNILNKMLGVFIDWGEKTIIDSLSKEAAKNAVAQAGATVRSGVSAAETAVKVEGTTVTTGAHATAEATKTGATAAGAAQRLGIEANASIQSLAISAETALGKITHSAGAAAAGAYEAIARIPYVGPILAPAAAATALAGVLAFGKSLFSAEGGWGQVPYDGALTQLHKNEMVLPASIASPLRSSLAAGGFTPAANQNAANDGGGDQYHVTIQALDGASVHRLLTSDQGVRALKAGFAAGRASGVLTRESF